MNFRFNFSVFGALASLGLLICDCGRRDEEVLSSKPARPTQAQTSTSSVALPSEKQIVEIAQGTPNLSKCLATDKATFGELGDEEANRIKAPCDKDKLEVLPEALFELARQGRQDGGFAGKVAKNGAWIDELFSLRYFFGLSEAIPGLDMITEAVDVVTLRGLLHRRRSCKVS